VAAVQVIRAEPARSWLPLAGFGPGFGRVFGRVFPAEIAQIFDKK
jgi:hypothetical protein